MSTWVEEAWASRRFSGDQVDLVYIVGGTSDDATAIAAAAAVVPSTYQTIFLLQTYPDVERLGYESWKITYHYKVPEENEQSETDGYEYEFDTGGATAHIQTAIADVAKYPSSAPTINQAINFVNGHAQGIDIQIPSYTWSERRQFEYATITAAYRYTLAKLTGKVNNAAWRVYGKGEVLFKGARGRFSATSGLWDISYSFAVSENKTNLSVCGQTVTAKEGWHHMQVRFAEADDSTSGRTKPDLIGVYIQQVIEYGDFSGLGFS